MCRGPVMASGVAGRFLRELDTGSDTELGVNVGEVGLHGARRDEKPRADVSVRQPLRDKPRDIELCWCQRRPAAGRTLATSTAAQRVRDRFARRKCGSFVPCADELVALQRL